MDRPCCPKRALRREVVDVDALALRAQLALQLALREEVRVLLERGVCECECESVSVSV